MSHPLDGDPERELKLQLGYREPIVIKQRDIVDRLRDLLYHEQTIEDAIEEINSLRLRISLLEQDAD